MFLRICPVRAHHEHFLGMTRLPIFIKSSSLIQRTFLFLNHHSSEISVLRFSGLRTGISATLHHFQSLRNIRFEVFWLPNGDLRNSPSSPNPSLEEKMHKTRMKKKMMIRFPFRWFIGFRFLMLLQLFQSKKTFLVLGLKNHLEWFFPLSSDLLLCDSDFIIRQSFCILLSCNFDSKWQPHRAVLQHLLKWSDSSLAAVYSGVIRLTVTPVRCC